MRFEVEGVKYKLEFDYYLDEDRNGNEARATTARIIRVFPTEEVTVAVADVICPASKPFSKDGGRRAALGRAIQQRFTRDQKDQRKAVWGAYFDRIPASKQTRWMTDLTIGAASQKAA